MHWQGFLNGSTGWLAQILHAIMAIIVPFANFFFAQCVFMPGVVISGVEK